MTKFLCITLSVIIEAQFIDVRTRPGADLSSLEMAMRFSVETMCYDTPLNYYHSNVWQSEVELEAKLHRLRVL